MADVWSLEREERGLDLRINYGLAWPAIALLLGLPSKDAPRIKINRLISMGRSAPPKGTYDYNWSLVNAHADVDDELLEQLSHRERTDTGELTAGPEYEVQAFIKHDYLFTGDAFVFSVNDQTITIPQEVWRRVVEDYSAQGGDRTQQEIAMDRGIPKKVLERCLALYGHYKARPPVLREELADAERAGETRPLIERAIEVAEHQFARKLESERVRHIERNYDQLRRSLQERDDLLTEARTLFQSLAGELPRAAEVVLKTVHVGPAVPQVWHLPVFDVHMGQENKEGWAEAYSTAVAERYLQELGPKVIEVLGEHGGTAQAIILSLGGDLFHALTGKTRSGTPIPADPNDRLVWRTMVLALIGLIEYLRTVTPSVVVKSIPGNHDHLFAELVEEALAIYYTGADDVHIACEGGRRTYFVVGSCMHILDHGEEFTSFGPKAFESADIIARRLGYRHYAGIKKIYLYVGHTHHKEVKTHGGHLELIRVQAISHASDYAENLSLNNEIEVPLYRLDQHGRIRTEERLYFQEPRTYGPALTTLPGVAA